MKLNEWASAIVSLFASARDQAAAQRTLLTAGVAVLIACAPLPLPAQNTEAASREREIARRERELLAEREQVRADFEVIRERIEALAVARPASLRVRSTPIGSHVYLIPTYVRDRNPRIVDSLRVGESYYAGQVADTSGLLINRYALPYMVVVQYCNAVQSMTVQLIPDSVRTVDLHVLCPAHR